MKKYILIFLLGISLLGSARLFAQDNRRGMMDSLTTVDPEIRKYFPRWFICETDLQVQITQAFRIIGYNPNDLNIQRIEVLAAPKIDPNEPYQLLLLSCGNATMNAAEIEAKLGTLGQIISGDYSFKFGGPNDPPIRDYCYRDIPPEVPVTGAQAEAIVSFMEPTNVTHAFTLSLFEQTLKIGKSGFWANNIVGTDQVGYPFWSSGEAKGILKRPLYVNMDPRTTVRIPYLINAYLGGGYRLSAGTDNQNTILSWVTQRRLNSGPGGKMVAGLDFHMPFQPEFGFSLNMELPLSQLRDEKVDQTTYFMYPIPNERQGLVNFENGDTIPITGIVPILRATGQVTVFYNWWLNEKNPENFIRFDAGISYCEVREEALYIDSSKVTHITPFGVTGLITYKPNEAADWIYLKAEYRNQATFPFGVSLQLSNQILLGRVYVPLLGNWLYLEGKYATPLRTVRPFENKSFFMISPVLRLTI